MLRYLTIASLFLITALAASAVEVPMRDRVWCDPVAGISFRYPYEWFCTNQIAGHLQRPNGAGKTPYEWRQGSQWMVIGGKPAFDVMPFSFTTASLPPGLDATATPAAVGDAMVGQPALTWTEWDYYRADSARPFAVKNHAPAGIVAALGRNGQRCCLVVRHGDRFSGVVLNGNPDDTSSGNQQLLDSFEVMAKKGQRLATWRELQCSKNQVQNAAGQMVGSSTGKPVAWKDALELETEHYHITANRDPARLLFWGAYYEALWRAYAKVFEPDSMPPLKAEVHVFERAKEFEQAGQYWISPDVVTKPTPTSIKGGFFTPGLLSLWTYEEVATMGGSMTSESVAAHECTHQFVHLTCNGTRHVPTWINEGLAVYFESGTFRNGEFTPQLPRSRLEQLKSRYQTQRSTLRPLSDYLDHHGDIDAMEYGEVFAMTHFWVFSDQGATPAKGVKTGKQRFIEFWKALKNQEDGNKAFERIFMADMITSQGNREAAVKLWTKLLMDYVNNGLRVRR